jgi:NAD(P)-dependent dehydrogenase (short-subunit alcohol dehydrogenase family)
MSAVVLVSGATSGMGLETTLRLARQGYRVFAGYRSDAGRRTLEDHAHELADRIIPVPLDVQDSISVDRAVASALRTAGRLDVLVNNAGYGLVASVEDGTDEEFIRQFDVNVFGVLRLCRAAIPAMRRSGGGVIVNVGSFLGHMGLPLLTHYNASKYAVEGITDSLRIELRDFGIRVHTVAPGLFRTDFVRRGLAANSSTTAAGSAYAPLADQLLPAVALRINEGPDPAGVAEAILQVIANPASPARVPVGEEAVLGETWKRSLDPAAFERQVQAFFGLAG